MRKRVLNGVSDIKRLWWSGIFRKGTIMWARWDVIAASSRERERERTVMWLSAAECDQEEKAYYEEIQEKNWNVVQDEGKMWLLNPSSKKSFSRRGPLVTNKEEMPGCGTFRLILGLILFSIDQMQIIINYKFNANYSFNKVHYYVKKWVQYTYRLVRPHDLLW